MNKKHEELLLNAVDVIHSVNDLKLYFLASVRFTMRPTGFFYRAVCTVFENHTEKYHSTLRGKRATFIYILSGQNFIKNAKKVRFGEVLRI